MAENKKERFEILLEEIKDKVQLSLEGHDALRSEIRQSEDRISKKIEVLHSSLKKEININALASHDLLTDVRKDVKDVKDKLDEHVRELHPV
jgi:hypothetical protein